MKQHIEFWKYSEVADCTFGVSVSELSTNTTTVPTVVKSITPETFSLLGLPMPQTAVDGRTSCCSLLDCLDLYVAPELLTGENGWWNKATGSREDVVKRMRFWKFPRILGMYLQRFSGDGRKTDTEIAIPNELKLQSLSQDDSTFSTYALYAVCCHVGNDLDSGHYAVYIKEKKEEEEEDGNGGGGGGGGGGTWSLYDDEQVQYGVPEDTVLCGIKQRKAVYSVFYRQLD